MGRRPMFRDESLDLRVWQEPDVPVDWTSAETYVVDRPAGPLGNLRPFELVLDAWTRPRRGDLVEPLEQGPFLDVGRLYVCNDVRESRGGWDRTPLLRVEFSSTRSPSGKIFGPPVERFAVAFRHVSLGGRGGPA